MEREYTVLVRTLDGAEKVAIVARERLRSVMEQLETAVMYGLALYAKIETDTAIVMEIEY